MSRKLKEEEARIARIKEAHKQINVVRMHGMETPASKRPPLPTKDMTAPQKMFVNLIYKGYDIEAAYKMIYQGTDFRYIRAAAEKMAQQPGVRECIERAWEERGINMAQVTYRRLKSRTIDLMTKREMLRDVIEGKGLKKVTTYGADGMVVTTKVYEDPNIIIRAIAQDEKLQAEWDELECMLANEPDAQPDFFDEEEIGQPPLVMKDPYAEELKQIDEQKARQYDAYPDWQPPSDEEIMNSRKRIDGNWYFQ